LTGFIRWLKKSVFLFIKCGTQDEKTEIKKHTKKKIREGEKKTDIPCIFILFTLENNKSLYQVELLINPDTIVSITILKSSQKEL